MKKYEAVDYVFQFITITAGVLIALLINGLVEWNSNRELVAEARATIAQELAANKQDLDSSLAGMADENKRLDNAIKFASDMLATRNRNKCDPEAWPSNMVKLTVAMMRIPRK